MFSVVLLFIAIVFLEPPPCRTKFSPTPQWHANVTQSLENRLGAAYSALAEVTLRQAVTAPLLPLLSSIDSFSELSLEYSQFYAALANFEIASRHNGTFRELATGYFQTDISEYYQTLGEGNGAATLRQAMDHGYAAIRWYKAYGDASFLQAAQACWNLAYSLTISDQTWSSNGTLKMKNFSIPDCSYRQRLEGATFQNASRENGDLNVYHAALFSLFSALLADSEPSNKTYVHAATKSLNFTLSFSDGVLQVIEYPPAATEFSCPPLYTVLNSGTSTLAFMIEAMAVLRPIVDDERMGEKLQQIISSALDQASINLFGPNGVLPNRQILRDNRNVDPREQEDGDMYLLRALAEARRRGLPAALRESVDAVLGVHYNALRDRATSGNNMYGRKWLGPPPSSFNLYDQAAAAQILVDGIELLGPTDEIDLAQQDRSTSTPSVGIIVGATVGSVAALSLLTFAVLCTARIRRRRKEVAPSSAFGIVPFATDKSEQRFPDLRKGGGGGHLTYQTRSPGGSADPVLEPLRFPGALVVADHSSGEDRAPNVPSYPVANVPDNRHRASEIADTGEMEMAPNFPEMVRAVYQRLWQHDGLENPPDYRSNAGDTQQ